MWFCRISLLRFPRLPGADQRLWRNNLLCREVIFSDHVGVFVPVMTELSVNRDPAPFSPQPTPQRKSSSPWKRAGLAGFFSLLIPRTGQLYNRQPRKALLLALPIPAMVVFAAKTRIIFTFATMVAFFALLVGWRLFIAGEAACGGWTTNKLESAPSRPRQTNLLIAFVLIVAALYPSSDDFKRWTSFGAFKVPTASMCPTICIGERIVADMGAYESKSPQRGDLVLLKHNSSPALFIKRIIGIPGDVVTPGPNGTILINGKALTLPEVCGSPIQPRNAPADYSMFESTKVPAGMFFVIGDNLGNSFDSRIAEFGPVTSDMIRGKPLYLYWSPGHSRIACPTR
jgi:signal peptidase I